MVRIVGWLYAHGVSANGTYKIKEVSDDFFQEGAI
jgi:hypothetical protein